MEEKIQVKIKIDEKKLAEELRANLERYYEAARQWVITHLHGPDGKFQVN